MLLSIPNYLTIFRLVLIPCFVVTFYLPIQWSGYITAGIFLLAALTDWLDGFLARKLNQTSRFGEFLDPVADKLMVAVALVLLVGRFGSILITIPAAIIVCREITISALREWMSEIGQRNKVAVGFMGKVKTTIQMIALLVLLTQPADWSVIWVWIGVTLMYIAVLLTLSSMMAYIRAASTEMNK